METDNYSLTAKEVATMFSRHAASIRDQLSTLRRQFLQDGDLPFTNILTEQLIAQALATITGWLDRIFPPLVTLWVFLGQVLSADRSCRAAVARLIALRRLLGTDTEEAWDAYQEPQQPELEDPWQEPRWEEDVPPTAPQPRPAPAPRKRWRHALGAALEAGLWWLGRQPQRRPLLTTVTVALAAGAVALFAGPTLGACAGVLASTTSLLLTVGGGFNDGCVAALFAC